MSDQINEFDQILRDRLESQTATPPAAVWENIKSTRTFGHVVANRISTNWRIFGTLLMLVFAGGSSVMLLGKEEKSMKNTNGDAAVQVQNAIETTTNKNSTDYNTDLLNQPHLSNQTITNQSKSIETKADQHVPDWELFASLEQAGFVRPELEDKRLSAYIEGLDGWESARPKAFVRYYQMDLISSKPLHRKSMDKSPRSVEIDYDYVMPRVERKTFKERSSILFSFTPQSITKIMQADYNLSSDYLEQRQKTERTRLAYTFGAMLHYEVKNHRFLESGIHYTQIYEEMSYEGEKRFSNQYDFLEIPILYGYEGRNAKWGWEVKGGFGIQVYNNYKGYILKRLDEFGGPNPDNSAQFRMNKSEAVQNIIESNHSLSKNQARNEVLDLENKEENPYKAAGVVNVHFAAGLSYYHSIRTTFVVTPYFKRSLNSITTDEAYFKENISYMGISFGARVNF